jgi:hypothetical protein
MSDGFVFLIICALAVSVVYFCHIVKEIRDDLNLQKRVEALEAEVLKIGKETDIFLERHGDSRLNCAQTATCLKFSAYRSSSTKAS